MTIAHDLCQVATPPARIRRETFPMVLRSLVHRCPPVRCYLTVIDRAVYPGVPRCVRVARPLPGVDTDRDVPTMTTTTTTTITTGTTSRTPNPAPERPHRETLAQEAKVDDAREGSRGARGSRAGNACRRRFQLDTPGKRDEERDPPRRREEFLSRRGWVAPRRPGINKTTARPSPSLGPACLLAEVSSVSCFCATPDAETSRRVRLPPPLYAPIPGRNNDAERRRAALRRELQVPRAHSLACGTRAGSILDTAARSVEAGKFAKSAFAEFAFKPSAE